jgi:hypothetical protein
LPEPIGEDTVKRYLDNVMIALPFARSYRAMARVLLGLS